MKLIINADDFGISKSITDGIIEGINEGYITSTSIMANMEYAKYAIDEAIKHNIKCIGLHINLTVGKPIIENKNLTDESGVFLYNKNQIDNFKLTYEDAYNEIIAQIDMVEKYSQGKIKIDHLDTHHALCDNVNIKHVIIDIAEKFNLPIRKMFDLELTMPDVLYKDFTINNVCMEEIQRMIDKYRKEDVIVELMTHPGYIDETTKKITSYLGREKELKVLKEAKDKNVFDGIQLISFNQL